MAESRCRENSAVSFKRMSLHVSSGRVPKPERRGNSREPGCPTQPQRSHSHGLCRAHRPSGPLAWAPTLMGRRCLTGPIQPAPSVLAEERSPPLKMSTPNPRNL